MATELIRVSAYVPADLADLIDGTAKALGQSRSAFIAELLESARPVFTVLIEASEVLTAAPESHRQALATVAEALRPMVEAGAEFVAESDPLTSNRGVTSP